LKVLVQSRALPSASSDVNLHEGNDGWQLRHLDGLGLAHDRAKADAREDEEIVALPRLELLAVVAVGVRRRPCSDLSR
jgi:hypothetical protein